MTRSLLPLTALVTLLSFVVGCASMEIVADYDPDVDFSAFRSFAHAPPPRVKAPGNQRLPAYNDLTARRIQRTIGAELVAKGLSETQPGEADLIVAFSLHGQQRRDIRGGGGGRWGRGGTTFTTNYVHGTLTIDMYQRRNGLHVWQGWASEDLYSGQEALDAESEAIRKILAKYPPGP